jgi:hypothetical protein
MRNKVKDILPNWGRPIGLPEPELIIANRKPTPEDASMNILWWYHRTEKIMYILTKNGYVKD